MNTGDTIGLESADILQIQERRSQEATHCDALRPQFGENPHALMNFIKKKRNLEKRTCFLSVKKWHVGDTTFTLEGVQGEPFFTRSCGERSVSPRADVTVMGTYSHLTCRTVNDRYL